MKQPKMLIQHQEIHLLVFFISCFTASVTPSINTPKSFSDFMILIISFIFSFEVNKVNPFPALTGPIPPIFLLNLFIAFEDTLLTNPGKSSLVKRITTFTSDFLPKLLNQEPKDLPC